MDFRDLNDPNRIKVFADSMFTSLREKGIKNLIIDLRNNGGGDSQVGDVLNYRLPVSGLLCTISFKRFWQYGADEKNIHGTLPDYPVSQDQAMDTALKLIIKQREYKSTGTSNKERQIL
jgi:hypothetical protein